jgi:hypothetical protein
MIIQNMVMTQQKGGEIFTHDKGYVCPYCGYICNLAPDLALAERGWDRCDCETDPRKIQKYKVKKEYQAVVTDRYGNFVRWSSVYQSWDEARVWLESQSQSQPKTYYDEGDA